MSDNTFLSYNYQEVLTMIIYQNSKSAFNQDVKHSLIANKIWTAMNDKGLSTNQAEINAWNNSMNFMKNILETDKIPEDAHVAIEYKIPYSQKRIDFLVTGYDANNNKNIVIIELKQWSHVDVSDKKDYVRSYVGQAVRELLHPSYQAKSYLYIMFSFMSVLHNGKIQSHCCSYLHNADKQENSFLLDLNKYSYVNECPIYFRDDYEKLQSQIAFFVSKGKGKDILFEIENSKLIPSKQLIDVVANTIKGNSDFMLIDSQKNVYENIMHKINETNNVYIVNGNPGTGKSVVALNLLASMLKHKKLVSFIAPNAAYRNNLINAIKKDKNTSRTDADAFAQVCKNSSSFYETPEKVFDWLIVDEAHRLKDKKAYMYRGENQIIDIVKSAKNVVFFVDDKQSIRLEDIGSSDNIERYAKLYDMNVYSGEDFKLETQFRCAGAHGYINALDTVLQLEETGNFYLNDNEDYDFRICDTPQEMQALIEQRVEEGYSRSKIVAGYAWKWESKYATLNDLVFQKDIVMEEYNYKIAWNYNYKDMLWAIHDDGVLQAGCVHSCQGLEFEYCGVIIGNDLQIDDLNNLYGSFADYKDAAGKKGLKSQPDVLSKYIKNIYKILLSRGQKGTYVFIRNPELRNYFKKHLKQHI